MESLFASLCSLFYIGSANQPRTVQDCLDIAGRFSWEAYGYNISEGIRRADGKTVKSGDIDPIEMLNRILDTNRTPLNSKRKVFILEHFDLLIENRDILLLTKLRLINDRSRHAVTVVLLGRPYLTMPEILSDIPQIHEPPLSTADIQMILKTCDERLPAEERETMSRALKGLTALECENLLSLSLARHGKPHLALIEQEKGALLQARAKGLIEWLRPENNLDQVGGIGVLKEWLTKRGRFIHRNRPNGQFGPPAPRGLLLTGPPGCGKSFVVSAISGSWGLPLVKLATSRLFASLVGQTEQNLLTALEMVRTLSPCILWVEEFEKFFPHASGIASDGGVLSRVVGLFLDFLQSEREGIFVCATTNHIHALPVEMIRNGRFDAVFFIDLPSRDERKAILNVLLKRYAIHDPVDVTDALMDASDVFSGAEMEQAVIEALYDSSERGLNGLDLLRAIKAVIPLAKSMGEEISGMREWCLSRTRLASYPEKWHRKETQRPCRISQPSRPN